MKVRELNSEGENQKHPSEKKSKLRNVLSILFDTIVRYEKSDGNMKSDREKVTLLKDLIIGMIKDDNEKKIIRGEG
jgi:hypothetical protein